MSNTDSPQVKVHHSLRKAFGEMDLDSIAKVFHKDFRHITYPKSLNIPERSRKEYLDYTEGRMSRWVEIGSPNVEVVVDIPGKLVVHATNKIKVKSGPVDYESIWISHIVTEADGSLKIKLVEEFVDSKFHELEANGAAEQPSLCTQ